MFDVFAMSQLKLHCLTWNVRGLNNCRKTRLILSYAKRHNIDFLFLQETHLTPQRSDNGAAQWEYRFTPAE